MKMQDDMNRVCTTDFACKNGTVTATWFKHPEGHSHKFVTESQQDAIALAFHLTAESDTFKQLNWDVDFCLGENGEDFGVECMDVRHFGR